MAGLAEAVPHPARAVAVVMVRSAAARAWRGMRKRILGSPLLRRGGCEDPAWFGDERRVFALLRFGGNSGSGNSGQGRLGTTAAAEPG